MAFEVGIIEGSESIHPLMSSQLVHLTPKGPNYVFWLYRNFGQVHVTRDFHILG